VRAPPIKTNKRVIPPVPKALQLKKSKRKASGVSEGISDRYSQRKAA